MKWEANAKEKAYDTIDRHGMWQMLRVKKVKSSMARSLPVENLLPQNVGSIINYLQ